jgi:exopolysaccharide biosynthesis polyprenyl glycosylphosphotransferase
MANGTLREEGVYAATRPGVLSRGEVETAAPVHPGSRRVAVSVAADVFALSTSVVVAVLALPRLGSLPLVGRLLASFAGDTRNLLILFFIVPWTVFVMYGYGLYRSSSRSISGWVISEALRGVTALSVATWSLLVIFAVIEGSGMAFGFLIVFWASALVCVPAARSVARLSLWHGSRFVDRTLIVGAGSVGHLLAEKIGKHPEFNLKLIGYLDDGEPVAGIAHIAPVVGRLEDLPDVIEQYRVTRVIIAFSRARHHQILNVVRTCADHRVRVNIVPRLFEILSSQTSMDDVEGIPLLDVAQVELSWFNMLVKRGFDLAVGGLATALALPLIGVLALAVKLDSPGPVFFRQERMGRGGHVFRIFKLRSMYLDAEAWRSELDELNEYSGPMFKMKRDPRVTRVGRFIRKWSFDELPQLFNVVKGDMSLVGPRPLWVEEARQCRGWTKKRLDITPGITGLWQVTGRNDIPFDEMVKLDYMYVTGWSIGWDIKILLETIPAVFGRRGAY